MRVTAGRHPAQLEPMLCAGLVLDGLVRGDPRRYQGHIVQLELKVRLLRTDQVTKMWRVERPAEDSDSHRCRLAAQGRMWPSPSTRYLNVHSSRSPIGPRAWSFWVEFPISAPIPNSPPSVNRVEALT